MIVPRTCRKVIMKYVLGLRWRLSLKLQGGAGEGATIAEPAHDCSKIPAHL